MADTAIANQENIKPESLDKPNKPSSGDDQHFRIIRTLGEGAYGEVLLVTDKKNTNLMAAMKVMNLQHSKIAERECKKERVIQQQLTDAGNHPNIIHFIGYRVDGTLMRLFIEYADGGELFDQIEPEKGVESTWKARHYFRQLMEGVKFIHQQGICHRDIKPENLFLTKSDVLKIGDFGLATLFFYDNKERILTMPCGTRPYASPELMNKSYRAQPTDIWSCGIVLVAMLSGELPWQAPDRAEESFRVWIDGEKGIEKKNPWSKMERQALFLLKWILNDNEKTRATVDQILTHPWCTERETIASLTTNNTSRPNAKRHKGNNDDSPVGLFSQPLHSHRGIATSPIARGDVDMAAASRVAFSQPATIESLLLSESQMSQSQRLEGWDALSKLARRMTRFCVTTDVDLTTQKVLSVCQAHGVTVHYKTPTEMVGTQRDVSFIVTIYQMSTIHDDDLVMVDFRRSRGDGLEFKRIFHQLRSDFSPIICEMGTNWLEQHGLTKSQMPPPS
ncbi:chk-1 [Pristionchus pacificus]|uniref:non-specific serine/threonine protein kinase n=1 Tax=Pristionchus pacificus TaxID=54126 RepID=A0A2A6CZS1_PRIPA|nr:chk-1 [Pristionchus pacificus]|eukprot:PDM83722.1 chk-1 [Pristionchus pacificus]